MKCEALVVLVEVVVGLLLEVGALDLLGGAVALGDLHAVGDAAHVEMGDRRALAGVDVLGLHDDAQLAVDVEHVAFAHRACDNLHHRRSLRILRVSEPIARRSGGRPPNRVGAFYRPFPASPRSNAPLPNACAAKPLVGRRHACRPPAVPAGARPHQGGAAPLVRGAGLHRGRDRRPAGLARQRDAPARLRHRADRPRRRQAAALPAHLAGVRLQEAAGGGRGSGSSRSPRCSATASAARCIIPSSPCSSGIARTSPTSG